MSSSKDIDIQLLRSVSRNRDVVFIGKIIDEGANIDVKDLNGWASIN